MRFEWDAAKDAANRQKHGFGFDEAKVLFATEEYLEIPDEAHSDDEERFIAVGAISLGVIVVVWTERADDVIRIISARRATARETHLYHEYMNG